MAAAAVCADIGCGDVEVDVAVGPLASIETAVDSEVDDESAVALKARGVHAVVFVFFGVDAANKLLFCELEVSFGGVMSQHSAAEIPLIFSLSMVRPISVSSALTSDID